MLKYLFFCQHQQSCDMYSDVVCDFLQFPNDFLTHIFLGEINEVLEINVVPVRPDVVVDEQVELIFDPVLEDKCQDSRRQLQEEDDSQEHGELQRDDRVIFKTHKHTQVVYNAVK